jgi:hypothetical protein
VYFLFFWFEVLHVTDHLLNLFAKVSLDLQSV